MKSVVESAPTQRPSPSTTGAPCRGPLNQPMGGAPHRHFFRNRHRRRGHDVSGYQAKQRFCSWDHLVMHLLGSIRHICLLDLGCEMAPRADAPCGRPDQSVPAREGRRRVTSPALLISTLGGRIRPFWKKFTGVSPWLPVTGSCRRTSATSVTRNLRSYTPTAADSTWTVVVFA